MIRKLTNMNEKMLHSELLEARETLRERGELQWAIPAF